MFFTFVAEFCTVSRRNDYTIVDYAIDVHLRVYSACFSPAVSRPVSQFPLLQSIDIGDGLRCSWTDLVHCRVMKTNVLCKL